MTTAQMQAVDQIIERYQPQLIEALNDAKVSTWQVDETNMTLAQSTVAVALWNLERIHAEMEMQIRQACGVQTLRSIIAYGHDQIDDTAPCTLVKKDNSKKVDHKANG